MACLTRGGYHEHQTPQERPGELTVNNSQLITTDPLMTQLILIPS